MTQYEKGSLILTTLAILAASYIGIIQNSINQKLVNLNFEPSLSIAYAQPTNNRVSGLYLTNNGKSNITLYNVSLFPGSISDDNKTFTSSTTIDTVISPGATVNIGGTDFLVDAEAAAKAYGNPLLDIFFKTSDDQKYLMESRVTAARNNNGDMLIYLDSTSYRKFNWSVVIP